MAKFKYPVCSQCGVLVYNYEKKKIDSSCGKCFGLIVKDGAAQKAPFLKRMFGMDFCRDFIYFESDIDLSNFADKAQFTQFKTEFQTFFDSCVITNPNYKPEFHEFAIKQEERELYFEEQRRRDKAAVDAIIKARERERYQREHPNVKCPYCGSTKLSRITAANRLTSVAMLGAASGKIGKQWHCKDCNSNF